MNKCTNEGKHENLGGYIFTYFLSFYMNSVLLAN